MSPRRNQKTELPRLIVVSAPSGAGKTTLCDMLLKEFPQVALSISTTTRGPRPYEKEGVHYHFVGDDEFQKRAKRGDFAEWAEVHGRRYGTTKATIEKYLRAGQHILFDIDVQGAMSLKKLYPDRTLLLFIHPPSLDILKQRLLSRSSDSAGSINTRLQNALAELAYAKEFDYEVTNDDLEKAFARIRQIVTEECL